MCLNPECEFYENPLESYRPPNIPAIAASLGITLKELEDSLQNIDYPSSKQNK